LLEAGGGQVMTLVDDQLAIATDEIGNLALSQLPV
jgi:hypothetical protein